MENVDKKSQNDLDWENRTLCGDESCIGVIGPDGCCKECGRPFDGELPENKAYDQPDDNAETGPADESEIHADDEAEEEDIPDDEDPDDEEPDDPDWENRTLCSDESCIGVIGPDGRCKECAKPFKG